MASGIEGYSSVITHRREGLLVPPKDEDALADALAALLKDAALRQRLGATGAMAVQEYRWERVARRVMDCYDASRDAWLASVSRRAVGMRG